MSWFDWLFWMSVFSRNNNQCENNYQVGNLETLEFILLLMFSIMLIMQFNPVNYLTFCTIAIIISILIDLILLWTVDKNDDVSLARRQLFIVVKCPLLIIGLYLGSIII